ncbi:MAG: hypothetical protein ABW185_05225 [Sedimenticola sp.]
MSVRWVLAVTLTVLQSPALAVECEAYAGKLEACAPYECNFIHPFSGKPMVKKIIGLQSDGNCLTREQMPGKMTMECRFDEPYRKMVAGFVRQNQAAKEVTTRAKIGGGGGGGESELTTRIDGRQVKNPLQEAMKKGYCQVVMPEAVAKPKR